MDTLNKAIHQQNELSLHSTINILFTVKTTRFCSDLRSSHLSFHSIQVCGLHAAPKVFKLLTHTFITSDVNKSYLGPWEQHTDFYRLYLVFCTAAVNVFYLYFLVLKFNFQSMFVQCKCKHNCVMFRFKFCGLKCIFIQFKRLHFSVRQVWQVGR